MSKEMRRHILLGVLALLLAEALFFAFVLSRQSAASAERDTAQSCAFVRSLPPDEDPYIQSRLDLWIARWCK